jgi:tetratricopeptide (TPR) repeat protein
VLAEITAEGEARYRLLEPVRQYAAELLEQSGEAEATRERHMAYYLALAESAEPGLCGPQQVTWLNRLNQEQDNLRAAIDRTLARGEVETASRFGWALRLFWWLRGQVSDGRLWLGAVLAHEAALSPLARARTLRVAAGLANAQGDRAAAEALAERALVAARAAGDRRTIGHALGMLGAVVIGRQRFEEGLGHLDESAAVFRAAGDRWGEAQALGQAAAVLLDRGEVARAEALAEQALPLARQQGDRIGLLTVRATLARAAQAQGDHTRAAHLFAEALVASLELRDELNIAYCLEGLAGIAVDRGEYARAARLCGAAEAVFETTDVRTYWHLPERMRTQRQLAAGRAALGEAAWAAAWAEGQALSIEESVTQALAPLALDAPPPSG